MTRFVYSPDGAAFDRFDSPPPGARAPVAYRTGITVWIPGIPEPQLLGTSGLQGWGLYPIIDSLVTCEPASYYDSEPAGYSWLLDGPLLGTTTSAIETRECVERPVADVYAQKESDIAFKDASVRYNAVDTSLSDNWWLVATQAARNEIYGIQGNWTQRQIDGQGWPSGGNAPWVLIFNTNDGRLRREQVLFSTQWETLFLELTQHDQATGNATNASGNALDAAYDDGSQANFDAVAAHDPNDPAWGYPPTVTLPPNT